MNFENWYDRSKDGSSKWLVMKEKKDNIPNDVIPMGIADMEFLVCPSIQKDIKDYISNNVLGYTRANKEYLESVVSFMDKFHDYQIKGDWIVTTPGIVSALATSVRAFTKENDGVVVFSPVYPPFYHVVNDQGRVLKDCPLLLEDNRYYIDFQLLEEYAKEDNTKMILLCSPHNPGGRVWTKEELTKISKIANENNLIVVSDEIHSDLMVSDIKHEMYGNIENTGHNSIVCTSPSKTFNIAGLQTSNIIIEDDKLRERFVRANEIIGIERSNVLGLVAARSAYTNGYPYLENISKLMIEHHRLVDEFFKPYQDKFDIMPADASFLSWVSFEKLGVSPEEFSEILLESNFFVNEGEGFGEAAKYFFRINLGLPTKELIKSLERFKKVLIKRSLIKM